MVSSSKIEPFLLREPQRSSGDPPVQAASLEAALVGAKRTVAAAVCSRRVEAEGSFHVLLQLDVGVFEEESSRLHAVLRKGKGYETQDTQNMAASPGLSHTSAWTWPDSDHVAGLLSPCTPKASLKSPKAQTALGRAPEVHASS